jgi:hypothetical protein
MKDVAVFPFPYSSNSSNSLQWRTQISKSQLPQRRLAQNEANRPAPLLGRRLYRYAHLHQPATNLSFHNVLATPLQSLRHPQQQASDHGALHLQMPKRAKPHLSTTSPRTSTGVVWNGKLWVQASEYLLDILEPGDFGYPYFSFNRLNGWSLKPDTLSPHEEEEKQRTEYETEQQGKHGAQQDRKEFEEFEEEFVD